MGQAFHLISHLGESSDNYKIAIEILKKNYFNEDEVREEVLIGLPGF